MSRGAAPFPRSHPRPLLALLVAAAVVAPAAGQLATPPGSIEVRRGGEVIAAPSEPAHARRVLFVGNSLTYYNEMPWLLEQIARSLDAQPPLVARFSGSGGMSLSQHLADGDVATKLRDERWDAVVLQGRSTEPLSEAPAMAVAARRLVALVRDAGATPILFVTWPPHEAPGTQPVITRRYHEIARELAIDAAPVAAAREAAAKLHVPLLVDGLHPNLAGTYLQACVFFAMLYDRSPVGAAHAFDLSGMADDDVYRHALLHEKLTPQRAAQLQRIAWDAVRAAGKPSPPP